MPQWAPLPDFEVSLDASGALGYGGVFQGHWFSGAWLPTQISQSIEYKELFPIVMETYLSGGHSAVWHFKSPYHHVLGSLSTPVGSSSLLLVHCLLS